jgi:hypothetical protein
LGHDSLKQFAYGDRLSQFKVENLVGSNHSERQRKCEYQARLGMKALGVSKRQPGAAQQALPGADQIVVTEKAQIALFGKPDTDLDRLRAFGQRRMELCGRWIGHHHAAFPRLVLGKQYAE